MKRLYQATRRAPETERCELCAAPLPPRHDHLFEPRTRQVRCACLGCALIIPTSETSPYRRIPDRKTAIDIDPSRVLTSLGVPVGVAAVIVHDDGRTVAAYPGPAGLVESELDATSVEALALPTFEREVEALLCSNLAAKTGAWIVGIDVVFEVIAELRTNWVGMSGGPEAPAAIARVIAKLEAR